jgi:hypothetical protein
MDRPTPKALSEHIFKLKKDAKALEGRPGTPNGPKTPTARTPIAKKTSTTTPVSGRKRKAAAKQVAEDNDSEDETFNTPEPKKKQAARTPRSSAKKAKATFAKIAAGNEEQDDSVVEASADSGSDFNPSTPTNLDCEPEAAKVEKADAVIKKEIVIDEDDEGTDDDMGTGAEEILFHPGSGMGRLGAYGVGQSFGVNGFSFGESI